MVEFVKPFVHHWRVEESVHVIEASFFASEAEEERSDRLPSSRKRGRGAEGPELGHNQGERKSNEELLKASDQ